MYPYFDNKNILHYIDDMGMLLTKVGNYIINEVEVYILEKINGEKTVDELTEEIAAELGADDSGEIRNVIMDFIESKPGIIFLGEYKNPCRFSSSGMKNNMIPMEMVVSLTDKCNLKCIHCFKKCSSSGETFIDYDKLIYLLEFLKDKVHNIQLTGGEPMLHPRFNDILAYCIENFTTTVTTTGTAVSEGNYEVFKGVENVQVSLYSYDRDKHESVTTKKGSYDKTIKTITELSKLGIPVTIATMLNKSNIEYMDKIAELASEIGCNHVRFGTLVPTGRGADLREGWLLEDEDFVAAKEAVKAVSERFKDKIKIQTWERGEDRADIPQKYKAFGCGAGIFTWAISERGIIKPCEFLHDSVSPIGNIYENSIEDIIKYHDFKDMPEGLLEWNKTLVKENSSVMDQCEKIKEYYVKYCK